MAEPRPPDPVKVFAAILWREPEALAAALEALEAHLGGIDFQGPDHPFTATGYYEGEMGRGLLRRILSFQSLAQPEDIVEIKLATNAIEEALRGPRGRRVNIDSGYLDVHKAVLASGKYGPPKIHVGQGIYAELVLRYSKGRFHPFEWSFQDFRDGAYDHELVQIRERYKTQIRGQGASPACPPPGDHRQPGAPARIGPPRHSRDPPGQWRLT